MFMLNQPGVPRDQEGKNVTRSVNDSDLSDILTGFFFLTRTQEWH